MGVQYEAPPQENKEFERPKVGNQPGRCIQVIDMGNVENTYPGAANPFKREILLVFELAQLMQDGRPFVVNWKGTMSLAETAHLSKHLEDWRGAKFTDEERLKFDFDKLLDQIGLINVIESPDKKDSKKIWTNIKSITPMIEGMAVPDRVNPLVAFGIQEIGTDNWNNLYPWVQKQIIEKSNEGKIYLKEHPDFEYGKKPETDTPADESTGGEASGAPFNKDDTIPF